MASFVTSCVLAIFLLFNVFSMYEGAPQFRPGVPARHGPLLNPISPRGFGSGPSFGPRNQRFGSGGSSISIAKSVSISRGGSSQSSAKSSAGSNGGFGGRSSASSKAAASSRGK